MKCPKCGSEMSPPMPAIFREGGGLWTRCEKCGYEEKVEPHSLLQKWKDNQTDESDHDSEEDNSAERLP